MRDDSRVAWGQFYFLFHLLPLRPPLLPRLLSFSPGDLSSAVGGFWVRCAYATSVWGNFGIHELHHPALLPPFHLLSPLLHHLTSSTIIWFLSLPWLGSRPSCQSLSLLFSLGLDLITPLEGLVLKVEGNNLFVSRLEVETGLTCFIICKESRKTPEELNREQNPAALYLTFILFIMFLCRRTRAGPMDDAVTTNPQHRDSNCSTPESTIKSCVPSELP